MPAHLHDSAGLRSRARTARDNVLRLPSYVRRSVGYPKHQHRLLARALLTELLHKPHSIMATTPSCRRLQQEDRRPLSWELLEATRRIEFNMIDGGIAVSNPKYVAIIQAIKKVRAGRMCSDQVDYQGYNDLLVLSLGTGNQVHSFISEEVAKRGLINWMVHKGETPLVDMVFNASLDMVNYNLHIIFDSQDSSRDYLQITTDSLEGSEVAIDKRSAANLERLVQTTQELLDDRVADRDLDTGELKLVHGSNESNRAALQRIAQFLSRDRKARAAPKTKPKNQPSAPAPCAQV